MTSLLESHGITKSFAGIHALDDVSISVEEGERVGLIGPNGAGKTTFFNCLLGILTPDVGTVHLQGRDISGLSVNRRARAGIGRTFQRIDPQTRTFVARVRVSNREDTLRPGMSFRVAADIDGELYPVVAETGVQWGADGAYVWSIENGTATRIPVQVIQRREGRVLVKGDFHNSDVVVVEGIQRMQEGVSVTYESPRVAGPVGGSITVELLNGISASDAG